MNSKERLMLALNKEKPDRLPVTVHQWQGYHLDVYMGGISDLEAFRRPGWTRRSSISRRWGSSGWWTRISRS